VAASRPAQCTLLRRPRAGAHQACERLQALGDRRVLDRGRDDVRRGARAARAPGQRRACQRPVVGLGAARREHHFAGVRSAHERRDGRPRVLQRALALRRAARPVAGRVGRGAGRVRCATRHHPLEQASHEGPGYLKLLRSRWWGKSSRRWNRRRWTGARLAAVDVRAGGVAKALAQEGRHGLGDLWRKARCSLTSHTPSDAIEHHACAWRAVSDLRKYRRRAVVVHVNRAADVRQRGAQARWGRHMRHLVTHVAAQRCAALLAAAQPERIRPASLYACYVCEAGAPGTDADCRLFFKPVKDSCAWRQCRSSTTL